MLVGARFLPPPYIPPSGGDSGGVGVSTRTFKMKDNKKIGIKGLIALLVVLLVVGMAGVLDVHSTLAQEKTVNYTLTNLRYRDFSNQNLAGTSFAGALMEGANFRGANLEGTILTKSNLLQADLTGANLSDVFGDRAIFDKANLTNAIFTDAILTSTSFVGAQIAGADFSGALIGRYQLKLMCEIAEGVNPVTGISTRESLGCPN